MFIFNSNNSRKGTEGANIESDDKMQPMKWCKYTLIKRFMKDISKEGQHIIKSLHKYLLTMWQNVLKNYCFAYFDRYKVFTPEKKRAIKERK